MIKNRIFVIFLIINLCVFNNNCKTQNKTEYTKESPSQSNTLINKQACVAGSFYPAEKQVLKLTIADLLVKGQKKISKEQTLAIISPHAGYVYSGSVAASAFNQIDTTKNYEKIFIIGSSHREYFRGASIYNKGDYVTPLGKIKIDKKLCDSLIINSKVFHYEKLAHINEHSLEVQLPFIQYILKNNIKIVPIIIGSQSLSDCRLISQTLKPYFNEKNLFIISSDFSHYPNYNDATKADKNTLEDILSNNPDQFIQNIHKKKNIKNLLTCACGWTSIYILMNITEHLEGIKYNHIEYKNSGDSKIGDKTRVVGYHAISVTQNSTEKKINLKDSEMENPKVSFQISDEDRIELLGIARRTLEEYLKNKKISEINNNNFSDELNAECGVFVTLHNGKELRGCIGRFVTSDPLYSTVQKMAISAATEDYRFSHVTLNELNKIDIEISVLTPLKKIESADDFELGKHGIYIIDGNNKGTFLPQVATETGWSKEEFLGHCARDKAGIGWFGWKNAELYTYEAIVFNERK